MTTDTFPKVATARAKIGDATCTINGIAKGAGMIAPDMATMLSFVFTDAPIAAPALQAILSDAVVDTFNAVTIDGDTSTSDTLAGVRDRRGGECAEDRARARSAPQGFRAAFRQVLANLSEQIARDGEGARKLVEIVVEGATSKKSARRIAMSIANLAAGENRDRRRGRQLGPRGHGVGQGRRAGRPRTKAVDLVVAASASPTKGARDPAYDEAGSRTT
jgi:glutamate N-acetyltransferase/amino-acid N-acetyltransferase